MNTNTPTKFAVILEGQGGELDRNTYTIPADCADPDQYVDDVATACVDGWILSIGDTVRIVEVQP